MFNTITRASLLLSTRSCYASNSVTLVHYNIKSECLDICISQWRNNNSSIWTRQYVYVLL